MIKILFFIYSLQQIIVIDSQVVNTICKTTVNKIMQCDPNSCDTILTCIPGVTKPYKVTKCDKNTPYCNSGLYGDYCSDVSETSNVNCHQIGTFPCTKTGFYPNVMDCHSYYYCNGDTPTVLPKFCPTGLFFNARTFICTRLVNQAQCYVPKCTKTGMFPYTNNQQFFYACAAASSGLLVPSIHRCDANEVFKNDKCTYLCWISGRFAHEDPTRYYECYLSGSKYEYLTRSCGTKTFNPVLKRCNY